MITLKMTQSGLPELQAKINRIKKGDMPIVKAAVRNGAEYIQKVWRSVVASSQEIEYDGNNFTVHRRTGNYERSVNVIYPYENDLSALIKADAKYAGAIESGTPAYDMKPGLLKGRQFVRIPFRHAAPGGGAKSGNYTPTGMKVMSEEIYNIVKQAGQVGKSNIGIRSKVISTAERRITYSWKAGMYSGMVKTGMAGHSQYITFRTVSVRSNPSSWWHPGTPPRPLSKAVAAMVKDDLTEMLRQAFAEELS